MDNKEKNDSDNKRNFLLCCQYILLPLLGFLGAIFTVIIMKWLPISHDLPHALNRLQNVLPFIVSFLIMTVLSALKKLYRFPPPAPKGTSIFMRARYAYVCFHIGYALLLGMLVYLLLE